MRDYVKDDRQSTYLYNLGTFFRHYQVGGRVAVMAFRRAQLGVSQAVLCDACRSCSNPQCNRVAHAVP